MAADEIHVSDVGTIFQGTIQDGTTVVNISSATNLYFLFKKPDCTTFQRTAVLVTDGTDGKMKYVVVAGDLDTNGGWEIQGYVQNASGIWHTDVHKFTVHRNVMEVT